MRETELTCDPADGALWVLPGVGTLGRTGRISRAATAEAGERSWDARALWLGPDRLHRIRRDGRRRRRAERPVDAPGGDAAWAGRDFTLRPDRQRRVGYVLLDDERRLALMTAKREGRRPLDVAIEDPAVDPGLLLFVAFIVQAYSDEASFPTPSPSG